MVEHSQHGFMRGKSCLDNLLSFYDKVTHLVDQWKLVGVIFGGILAKLSVFFLSYVQHTA